MSIKVPKYVIQEKDAVRPHSKLGVLTGVFIAIGVGYFLNEVYSNRIVQILRAQNEALEESSGTFLDKVAQLESKQSLLEMELKVKQQALLGLQNDYKLRLDDLNQLKQDIQFYERLLSPGVKNKGLRVFEAGIVEKPQNIKAISVVFVNKIARASEVYGTYSIHIVGKQGNKEKTINTLKDKTKKYRFKYFHKISFDFSLPDGFKPEQLVVKLFPKTEKAKTIEYKASWHSLIK